MLAGLLTDFKDALMTGLAGSTRPSQLAAGGMWVDTSQQAAPNYYWSFKLWTGTVDYEVFRLNINTGFGGPLTSESDFSITHISADTVGAFKELIKQRIANNGQVLSGDVVGEIRFIGRTITSTDPVVAYMKWSATDDETATVFGGTFSFYSTADGTNTVVEHLRFIEAQVETVLPLKSHSLVLVSQNVATASQIVQLSGDTAVVEMTGATATQIKGVNSTHKSRIVTIHNRSTAIITLKHENTSASAVDRIKLPGSADYTIEVDGTISLYYCTTDARWKLYSTHRLALTQRSETITGLHSTWTSPSDAPSLINVTAFKKRQQNRFQIHSSLGGGFLRTKYGKLYSWGVSSGGVLGDGDAATPANSKSSPVAVVGGLNFTYLGESNVEDVNGNQPRMFAIASDGVTYAWGNNTNGILGVGDTTARSSPVAVVGGLKFKRIFRGNTHIFGTTEEGLTYAWGGSAATTKGELGVGDANRRSSPVLVLGNLQFDELYPQSDISFGVAKTTGILYAWGENSNGTLGVGDTTARSSPVAVLNLSGTKIKKLVSKSTSSIALTKDGTLYGWGNNSVGQLGLNDLTSRSSPVLILSGVVDFWSNGSGTIAKKTDGLYYGWGLNNYGLLGIGDITNRSSPVLCTALNLLSIRDIQIVANNGFAWTTDGVTYGWGINDTGQLGDGTSVDKSSPVVVMGGLKIAEINYLHFATPEGTLYARGDNNFFGALGNGEAATLRSSPVLVLGPSGVDPSPESVTYSVAVLPSTTYSLKLGVGLCFFGQQSLGSDIEKLIIDYVVRGNL